jgi:hypothetical protein
MSFMEPYENLKVKEILTVCALHHGVCHLHQLMLFRNIHADPMYVVCLSLAQYSIAYTSSGYEWGSSNLLKVFVGYI